MATEKLDIITVKGKGDDNRVALWERDEAHPDGEAFVVNDGKSYRVAETGMVKRLLGEGTLVKGGATAFATEGEPRRVTEEAAAAPVVPRRETKG